MFGRVNLKKLITTVVEDMDENRMSHLANSSAERKLLRKYSGLAAITTNIVFLSFLSPYLFMYIAPYFYSLVVADAWVNPFGLKVDGIR